MRLNPIRLITRKLRSKQVLNWIDSKEKHLDIGCDKEMYLLKKSPCKIKVGLDKFFSEGTIIKSGSITVYGQNINKTINLNEKFDYITLMAVIEHLDYPGEIIKECHRLLKDKGILIITTPIKFANNLIKIYYPPVDHSRYMFNKKALNRLISPYFKTLKYKKFEFGLNQLIVAQKNENK